MADKAIGDNMHVRCSAGQIQYRGSRKFRVDSARIQVEAVALGNMGGVHTRAETRNLRGKEIVPVAIKGVGPRPLQIEIPTESPARRIPSKNAHHRLTTPPVRGR